MTDLNLLISQNAQRWNDAQLTRDFSSVATRLNSRRSRYQKISDRTGVPWFVIAVIHEREAGNDPNFTANIANGELWNRETRLVPRGRGPFRSFEDAAYDALVLCPPFAAKNKDWSAGGTLTLLEKYNGLGYANKGLPSPYIWSGTDQYEKGKYTSDGHFDPNAVDKQLGCAGILKAMGVTFEEERLPEPKADEAEPPFYRKWWKWITGGVAVAGLGTGAVLLGLDGRCSNSPPQGQLCNVYDTKTPGFAALAGGAVFAGVSIYLFATQPKEPAKTAFIVPTPDGAIAGLAGTW